MTIPDRNVGYAGRKLDEAKVVCVSLCELFGVVFSTIFGALLRPDSHIPDTQPIRFGAAEKASVAIFLGVPMLASGIGDTK